jgi:kinesin family protein C1
MSRPASALEGRSASTNGRLASANKKGMPPISISTYQAPSGLAGSCETERQELPSWSSSRASFVALEDTQTCAVASHRVLSINTAITASAVGGNTAASPRTRNFSEPSPSSTATRRLGFYTSRSPTSPRLSPTRHSFDPFNLQSQRVGQNVFPKTPSRTPGNSLHRKKYLTRDTNTTAFDPTERLEGQEVLIAQLQKSLNETDFKWGKAEESMAIYQAKSTSSVRALFQDILEYGAPSDSSNWRRLTHGFVCAVNELEAEKGQLRNELESIQRKYASTKKKLESQLSTALATIEDERRVAAEERRAIEEDQRIQQTYIEDLINEHRDELDLQENDYRQKIQSMQQQASEDASRLQGLNAEGVRELERARADLEREKAITKRLQDTLTETSTIVLQLQSADRAKQAKIDYLESDGQAQAQSFADVLRQMQEAQDAEEAAKEKLRAEESMIRKLRNQVQELKGNIRVFCRVRPPLGENEDHARIALPDVDLDSKEIEIQGPEERSSLGTVKTKTNAFTFDRVFGPTSQNRDVFEEISQLVQSALDGYNVCIFCYGQTGAGKTHTMSSEDGMIPRALHQIYDTARGLEEKGWRYTMEGSFVEVYNEVLNDLLGKPEDYDKTKHEIRHDPQTCKTTVTDLTAVVLDSPAKVESILRRATANRTVASTKANERSSRSHSVFILRLTGINEITGEKSDGTLNLVDLAGSERLSHSGSTGDRLKETQNINKSLSCLGDVIGALGQGKEGGHVPYRNSKVRKR